LSVKKMAHSLLEFLYTVILFELTN
jgi:hypothetical protein